MMKTPQRELHDYIAEISERADVRAGSPLPLGIQERGGGVNFAIFSRYASRVRLKSRMTATSSVLRWPRLGLQMLGSSSEHGVFRCDS
jgi:hypothetical protein